MLFIGDYQTFIGVIESSSRRDIGRLLLPGDLLLSVLLRRANAGVKAQTTQQESGFSWMGALSMSQVVCAATINEKCNFKMKKNNLLLTR